MRQQRPNSYQLLRRPHTHHAHTGTGRKRWHGCMRQGVACKLSFCGPSRSTSSLSMHAYNCRMRSKPHPAQPAARSLPAPGLLLRRPCAQLLLAPASLAVLAPSQPDIDTFENVPTQLSAQGA